MSEYMFQAEKISKSYSGHEIIKGVDIYVKPGEVVGLIGANGAGKSTLLKIIIGAHRQSSGTMFFNGEEYKPRNPMEAKKLGVGMVYQEQSLVVNLNVAQNIFLGHENEFKKNGIINWSAMNAAAKEVLAAVDITNINPTTKVSELNFATRQMVEIAKVINITRQSGAEHCLILLDEPTSVLNEAEVNNLFVQIRKIVDKGHSVIFVSHRLNEVLEITDRIYVFKNGESKETTSSESTEHSLSEMMVGQGSGDEYYHMNRQTVPRDEVILEVSDLARFGLFKKVNFKLHAGEVLGLCGVVGSGIEAVCETICGDAKPTHGEISIKEKKREFANPAQALSDGIIMIPKERLFEGIVDCMSVEDNIALSNAKLLAKGPFVSAKDVTEQAKRWIEELKIKTRGPKQIIRQLSGGNQQKVVFSRALASDANIVILNHPTRGVDIGAKSEIYALIRDMTEAGKAVILLGDTVDEYIGLSSRIIVMKDGMVTGEFDAAADNKPSQVDIIDLMM